MKKMEYNTKEKCNEFFTDPGDRYVIEYDTIVEPNGKVTLVETGKKDLFQEIQSWREQTDMHYVLSQMALGKMQPRQGMYGDFTEVPESMVQAMQLQINAEKEFFKMPVETRRKFDNDWRQWLVMMQTDYGKYSDIMGFNKDPEVQFTHSDEGEVKE